ncbi:MAG: glycosyltransferase family 1 protein, partial [Bacteroidota bacterium]
GNYSRTLLANLHAYRPEHNYFLYTPSITLKEEKNKLEAVNNVSIRTAGSKNRTIWRSFEIKNDIQKDELDVYHGLSHELPRNNENMRCKKIVTIHDLIFKPHPEFFPFIDRGVYHIKCKHSLHTADRVIAISEHTKRDIIEYYNIEPEKIDVIYQSCLPQYYEDDPSKIAALPKSFPSEYNLSVGSLEPRKNIVSVIKAYTQIKKEHRIPLFLIGNGKRHKKYLQQHINKYNLQEDIHILSNIPTHLLPAIYRNATMLIYPSFYEGFGLPVVEALLSFTPVITSNISSLPEAGGPDTCYINPSSIESIAQSIEKIQTDSELASRMSQNGRTYALNNFNPQQLTAKVMRLYEEIQEEVLM